MGDIKLCLNRFKFPNKRLMTNPDPVCLLQFSVSCIWCQFIRLNCFLFTQSSNIILFDRVTISWVRAAYSVNYTCSLYAVNVCIGQLLVATISVPDYCLHLYHNINLVSKNYRTDFQQRYVLI